MDAEPDPWRRERQALAARIHDGIVQQLTAATLFCDTALLRLDQEAPNDRHAREPLQRGVEELREAAAACRALMAELTAEGPADDAVEDP